MQDRNLREVALHESGDEKRGGEGPDDPRGAARTGPAALDPIQCRIGPIMRRLFVQAGWFSGSKHVLVKHQDANVSCLPFQPSIPSRLAVGEKALSDKIRFAPAPCAAAITDDRKPQ
jgi:hypothetical protein